MAATAIPQPSVEHRQTVERDEALERERPLEREEALERDKTLDRYETIDYDALDNERLGSFRRRSPVRGIMIAAPVGAGIWALVISLVRLALS